MKRPLVRSIAIMALLFIALMSPAQSSSGNIIIKNGFSSVALDVWVVFTTSHWRTTHKMLAGHETWSVPAGGWYQIQIKFNRVQTCFTSPTTQTGSYLIYGQLHGLSVTCHIKRL